MGDEVFKETWNDIQVKRFFTLSEIENFDYLDLSYVEY